jgi:hypothetical protein
MHPPLPFMYGCVHADTLRDHIHAPHPARFPLCPLRSALPRHRNRDRDRYRYRRASGERSQKPVERHQWLCAFRLALRPPPSALRPPPSALSPQPSALSPQPSALSPQPSALSASRFPLGAHHPFHHTPTPCPQPTRKSPATPSARPDKTRAFWNAPSKANPSP